MDTSPDVINRSIKWVSRLAIISILISLSAGIGYGQEKAISKNTLFPEELLMHYMIDFKKSRYLHFGPFKRLDGKAFCGLLIDDILKNRKLVYDPNNPGPYYPYNGVEEREILDPDRVLQNLEIEATEYPVYIGQDLYNREEINALIFTEAWHFDESEWTFRKEVRSFTPVREYSDTARYRELRIRVLERLNQVEADTERREYLGTIFFEFPLMLDPKVEDIREDLAYFTEQARNPFWTSYNRRKLVDVLIRKVFNNEVPAYRYGTNVRTNRNEIERAFNAGWMTMAYQDQHGDMQDTSVYIDYNIEEIQSLVFVEDWYINPEGFTIYKNVAGIAPVRHFINPETEEWDQRILFIVYFDPGFENRVIRMFE